MWLTKDDVQVATSLGWPRAPPLPWPPVGSDVVSPEGEGLWGGGGEHPEQGQVLEIPPFAAAFNARRAPP